MKINKTLTVLSVITMLVATTMISSCKYEEGPAISLRSKKARVANEWVIEKFIVDGQDITALFLLDGSPVFTFDKDGGFAMTSDGESAEGTWEFSSSKDELILTWKDDPEKETWTILKLKNNEMWITTTDGDEKSEVHFKSK